jgi:hypothetical protein
LDRAAAVLTLRNRPFEVAVIQGVVFDFDCEPFVCWIQRWAARHRPRFENAIPFKAQAVVQAGRRVFLHDETTPI